MDAAKNLPATKTITPEDAISAIEKDFPNEAEIFKAVLKKDVLALGTDEVFALRDSEGEIKAYRRAITFTEKDSTLIQPVQNGPFVISAQGYEFWAEAVGACVIMPPDVLVDGVRQQNPFVVRDPANRRILAIYARAVVFRFSPMGLPMVSDWTTIFDNPSYRLIDLLAKAKKTPQAFRLLPADQAPEDDGQATWASYPFDESTNLWVNTNHEEVLTWYSQIINREKKSIDFAQTFAKRNALKHLSGLQKSPSGNVWKVIVTAWKAVSGIVKWDATQYAHVQKITQNLTTSNRNDFKVIEHTGGIEHIETDDAAEITDVTGGDEDGAIDITATVNDGEKQEIKKPDEKGKTVEQKKGKMSEADLKVLNNLSVAKKEFSNEYATACKNLGITSVVTAETAKKVMKEINRITDLQNA